jgi:hypothetical protein
MQEIKVEHSPLIQGGTYTSKALNDYLKEEQQIVFTLLGHIFGGLSYSEKFTNNKTFIVLTRKIGKMKDGFIFASCITSLFYLAYRTSKLLDFLWPNNATNSKLNQLTKNNEKYPPLFLKCKPKNKNMKAFYTNKDGSIKYSKLEFENIKTDLILKKTLKLWIAFAFFMSTTGDCFLWLVSNNIGFIAYSSIFSVISSIFLIAASLPSIVMKGFCICRSSRNLKKLEKKEKISNKENLDLEKLKQKTDRFGHIIDLIEQIALLIIGIALTLSFAFGIFVPFLIPGIALTSFIFVLTSTIIKNTQSKFLEKKHLIKTPYLFEVKKEDQSK